MGYLSTVLVLNDALETIRENPKEFVEGMYTSIMQHSRFKRGEEWRNTWRVGGFCNPAQVIACHHADSTHVMVVGQNLGLVKHRTGMSTSEDNWVGILRDMAAREGYKLVKETKDEG